MTPARGHLWDQSNGGSAAGSAPSRCCSCCSSCWPPALRAPSFSDRVFNADEAYLATQAQVLLDGGHLYVDTVDRKPPVVPYLYAAVFGLTGSDDLAPVHVVAVVAQALTALLLAAEARRRFRWRLAPVFAGCAYLLAATAFRAADAQAANFEVFMLPVMTAAMLLGIRRRPAAAGATLALATLTKQTAAVTLLPLAFLAWRVRRWRSVAALGAAFAAPIVLAAAVFGPRDFAFWVFTGNGGYADIRGVVGYTAALGARRDGVVPVRQRRARGDAPVRLARPSCRSRPVAVAGIGRDRGRDRVPVLPALLPAAPAAARPPRDTRRRT